MPRRKPKLELRRVAISKLQRDPQNAKTHGEENISAIAASLARFGQREPLVVSQGIVYGGNGRIEAMERLGWDECDITVHDDLTPSEARALALVLNRTAEIDVGWDVENLKLAVEAVELEVPDLDLQLDVVEFATDGQTEDIEEDEPPEIQEEAIAKRGDIITLGRPYVCCPKCGGRNEVE